MPVFKQCCGWLCVGERLHTACTLSSNFSTIAPNNRLLQLSCLLSVEFVWQLQASTSGPDRVSEAEKKRNRRNIGRLLERGLHAALPSTHFPFAVRLNADLLSADGSESTAALSAASLALADAGVPIDSHVAGGFLVLSLSAELQS